MVIKKCNCFISTSLKEPDSTYKPCLSPSESDCALAEFHRISKSVSQYDVCPIECSSIEYPMSMSFSNLDDSYVQFLCHNSFLGSCTNNSRIKNYLLIFDVYYTSLSTKTTIQSSKMDSYEVLSGIGGFMGLFLGLSLLNFAEYIELFVKHILIKTSKVSP